MITTLMVPAACAAPPPIAPDLVDRPHPVATSRAPTALVADTTRPGATSTTQHFDVTPDVRRAEIEALTKPLWFGWYTAVAAGDVDALGETVALNRVHADGVAALTSGTLDFTTAPLIDDYDFSVTEVLRDDSDCIVIALREDPSNFLSDGIDAERIGVFWKHAGRWYLATSWTIDAPEFAWGDDCSLMVREFA